MRGCQFYGAGTRPKSGYPVAKRARNADRAKALGSQAQRSIPAQIHGARYEKLYPFYCSRRHVHGRDIAGIRPDGYRQSTGRDRDRSATRFDAYCAGADGGAAAGRSGDATGAGRRGPNGRNRADCPIDDHAPAQGCRPSTTHCDHDTNHRARTRRSRSAVTAAPITPAVRAIAQPGYTEVVAAPGAASTYPAPLYDVVPAPPWLHWRRRRQRECLRSRRSVALWLHRCRPTVTSMSLTASW